MKKLTLSLLAGVAAIGFASSALAADLIIEDDFVEPGVVVIDDWSGVYIGGHVGWGWAHIDVTEEDALDLIDPYEASGFLIGGQIGANVQMDALVFGVVGDLAWTNITGDSDVADPDDEFLTTDIHWLGTVRGKLGFAADAFMIYGTAGIAFAGVDTTLTEEAFLDETFTDSATRFGWVAGIGAEAMVAENVSIFAEALYHDFGDADISFDDDDEEAVTSLNVTTVKVGVNFHF
jgi:outer membrane immunogenic protein